MASGVIFFQGGWTREGVALPGLVAGLKSVPGHDRRHEERGRGLAG